MLIQIHIVIFVHTTHESKQLHLPVGGISSSILELLPVYEKNKNLKISLITKYSEYIPFTERARINIIYKFLISKINTIYFFLKSFIKIVKIHKIEPIHVINIHSFYYDLITPLLLRMFFKIPLFIKPPSDFITQQKELFMAKPHNPFTRMVYFGWMNFFKRYVIKIDKLYFQAINEKIYNDLLELKIPKKNILKVPNGISTNRFLRSKKNSYPETHFGYVGRLIKSKNLRFLLKTFTKYLSTYSNDKLYFFGKGPEENYILKFISRKKLSNNIILWGFEKNKSKIYSNIDVLIHPSFGEGCPNTILESALTYTFVIASNVSGIIDIIDHKISGLLFNPFDEEDLLEQLLFYKKHSDSISNLMEVAKNKVMMNYDVEIVAKKIYQFLRSKLIIKAQKTPLRISIVTPVFPYPKRGVLPGVERYVENLAIPLKQLGQEVKIVTCFWNGGSKYDEYYGIPILRVLDSKRVLGKIGSIFHLNNLTFGLNIIMKKNFSFYADSDIILMPLALGFTRFFKIKNIPLISGFLHHDPINYVMEYLTLPFYNHLEKRQFKKHKNVITISNASKDELIKLYRLEDKNIKVFPIGIDTNRFNPSNYSEEIRKKFGKNILLYVGPFLRRKRIPILLKAMTHVIKEIKEVHLILIGKGLLLEYCKNLSNSLGLKEYTTFLGFVDDRDLSKYYASADIYIFPSELEGFGQVILEAMASGTPVICANKPPMSEIIENGGKTFELNDPEDLSKKIVEILKDRNELKTLKKNTSKIIEKYKLSRIAADYINYFKEIIEKNKLFLKINIYINAI